MDRPARLSLGLALAPMVAACATTPSLESALHLEDRPSDGIVRVHNRSDEDTAVWYNYSATFSDGPLMLHVRWRDRDKRIIHFNGTWPRLGWWTPLTSISSLCPVQGCRRERLAVPARGHVDLQRDVAWFTDTIRDEISAAGPCEIQFVLFAYDERRSNDAARIASDWQPADCPRRTM